MRYFFLDLTLGTFKYGKSPMAKQTIYSFKDINSLEISELVDKKRDKEYHFCFKLKCSKRDIILAAKTFQER